MVVSDCPSCVSSVFESIGYESNDYTIVRMSGKTFWEEDKTLCLLKTSVFNFLGGRR